MTMVDGQDTITTLEAAERLGLDVLGVYRMIDEGRLAASWNGSRLVVPTAQIDAVAKSVR